MRTSTSLVRTLLAATAALGLASLSLAQSVTTAPVGAVSVTIRGNNSDTIVSLPLASQPIVQGAISSVSAPSGNFYTLTLPASSVPASSLAGLHYVRVITGAKAGMFYTVTANTTNTLTVDGIGDDLSQILAGDKIKVYKYWTLNTLFPVSAAGTPANPLTPSLGTLVFQRRSQVLLPDISSVGSNLAPSSIYYFTASGWVRATTGNPVANDTVIYPDNYIIIRQPDTVVADTTLSVVGGVSSDPHAIVAATNTTRYQDNPVALQRPADVRLDLSGFSQGFVQSSNTLVFNRRDQLLVYDNPSRGLNLAPTKVFYMVGGNWIDATQSNAVANNYIVPATSGIVLRKYQTLTGNSTVSTNNLYVFDSSTNTWTTPTF